MASQLLLLAGVLVFILIFYEISFGGNFLIKKMKIDRIHIIERPGIIFGVRRNEDDITIESNDARL